MYYRVPYAVWYIERAISVLVSDGSVSDCNGSHAVDFRVRSTQFWIERNGARWESSRRWLPMHTFFALKDVHTKGSTSDG